VRRTLIVDLFWKLHPFIYRVSGGRLLGRLANMDVLLLTTTGARTGQPRTTALTFIEDAGRHVVIGSFLGAPRDPGWVHNLRAHPTVGILLRARRFVARAHEARGEERERLWARAVAVQPDYRQYETDTTREIPVVVLTPSGDEATMARE
jgi:deazaflavin-dependent oxidoreductase (nitroreductase family)